MGKIHTVVSGECLSGIVYSYGLEDWEAVYNLPENAEFRALRPDPNLIHPGDEIYIPVDDEEAPGLEPRRRHRYRLPGTGFAVQFVVSDQDGRPQADKQYELTAAGATCTGRTGEDGLVLESVPADASSASLKVWLAGDLAKPTEWTLTLTELDPIDSISGIQARLNNLAFDAGPVDGIDGPLTQAGVKAFQAHHGLTVDGIAGPITQGKLQEVHGR